MLEGQTGKRALVIEDSPSQSLHLQSLLESNGLNCVLATDGQNGLDVANALLPDIIILDIEMPNLNGFQVCQQLKTSPDTAEIPVILMTHHDESEFEKLGLELGVIEFIPKDAFADAVLVETLKAMKIITTGSLNR